MNLTVFATDDSVFTNCECIKGYTFKMVMQRGKSIHIANDFASVWDKSVHMTVLNASYRINMS